MYEEPIESPGSISVVERYHAPLRAASNRIKMDYDDKVSDQKYLQMAVYAVIATTDPEGYCPMLLVCGVLPRPDQTSPCPTQLIIIKVVKYETN